MAEPTEDEVRMALMVLGNALGSEAQHLSIASAIATIETALDEARKDRALIDNLLATCRELDVGQRSGDVHKAQRALLNWRKALAAIDQARGEEKTNG